MESLEVWQVTHLASGATTWMDALKIWVVTMGRRGMVPTRPEGSSEPLKAMGP